MKNEIKITVNNGATHRIVIDDSSVGEAFPASRMLLSEAEDEYARERERSTSLDNKSGAFIAAIIAIITIYVPILPFKDLGNALNKASGISDVMLRISLVLMTIAFSFLGDAFFQFYKGFKLRDYKSVCLENLTDKEMLIADEDVSAEAMIRHYVAIIDHNREVNDEKTKHISFGLKQTVISFLLLSVSTISILLLVGGNL